MRNKLKKNSGEYRAGKCGGFTLLEVLMVIGILAILSGVVLSAINPSRQFKIARDSQRTSNVTTILNAVGQNMTDHGGNFICEGVLMDIPSANMGIASEGNDNLDLAPCLVPDYISMMPNDPAMESAYYTDETDYNTGYGITKDVEGRISVSAQGEVGDRVIVVTR